MKNIKLFYIVLFLFLFSFSSCVCLPPFFPRRYYSNGLPGSVYYNEHGYGGGRYFMAEGVAQMTINEELQNFILNGAYVGTRLDREGFSKFYYIHIYFSHVRAWDRSERDIRKEFTKVIIKDLQIKSESGIDYSDRVGLEFPYDVLSVTEELGRRVILHRTDAVFDFNYERIEVIVTVEVSTEDATESKTLVYYFEPKVERPPCGPIFLLPFN